MSAVMTRPRCGQSMGWHGEKRCGRPSGHKGAHLSAGTYNAQLRLQAAVRRGDEQPRRAAVPAAPGRRGEDL